MTDKKTVNKKIYELYSKFKKWCDSNRSFDLDTRLHTSGGSICNGGYISDRVTRIAFSAYRAGIKEMTNQKTIEQHRADFEAWFSNGYKWLRRIERHPENSSCYVSQEAGIAWQAWLAARGVKENQE